MKNKSILIIYCFLILILGCSNSDEVFEVPSYLDTLKAATESSYHSVEWTQQIDPYILDESLKSDEIKNPGLSKDGLSQEESEEALDLVTKAKSGNLNKKKRNILMPEALFLSNNNDLQTKVYPFIRDFASLDISLIKEDELLLINSFLESLKSKTINPENFILENRFITTLLQYDIQEWPELIDWIIGKPYKGDFYIEENLFEIYEIPVRLIFEISYLDIIIDLTKDDSEKYLIEQVSFNDFITEDK